MTFDASRFTFHPFKDFFGVVMQQGRVQLDSDWNEWVAELARRLQAGTLDTFGRAVVPRVTPDGFLILATAGALTIGAGRLYVDGLLAENHGGPPLTWNTALAELTGTTAVPFFAQPYLPFNPTNQTPPTDVFNRPTFPAGVAHLVYADVWQREVTYLQEPELVEDAIGVDTTGRLQTVWQVRVLPNVGGATCATPDDDIEGWGDVIRPSGARLTTSTADVPDDPNPCLTPPGADYRGLENQLYRVEIHRGGPRATATFKWSRDNATVASRVTEIHGNNRLVVESIGRDDVLGFHGGEWIEILDDWHELHGRPGVLRRIRAGDGVNAATRSIVIDDTLPTGLFPVNAQNLTDPTRHTRIRRWDQARVVRRANGTVFHDLDASASSNGIPIPPDGVQLALESGILVDFDLESGGEFKTGDYWVFAARVADGGSIELLDHAPPRGIHHHYARLAIVTLPDAEADCRVLWPPEAAGGSCDCTVCVNAEGHNQGTATIQQAIDRIRTRGGTICLDAGTYQITAPLELRGATCVRIRGQGWRTVLQAATDGPLIHIQQADGIAIERLSVLGIAARGGPTAMITATDCVGLDLAELIVVAEATGDATSAAIGLSGVLLEGAIRNSTLVAGQGVIGVANITAEPQRPYLLTANLDITDNAFLCGERAVSLTGMTIHYGLLRVADNLVLRCDDAGIVATGGALPAASVTITGNVLHVTGAGVRAGTDGLRISDNEIVGIGADARDGIALEAGLDPGPLDQAYLMGNRIRSLAGNGIAIRRTIGQAMIKDNVVEAVTGTGLAMDGDTGASYLDIENNHFTDLLTGAAPENRPLVGILLLRARRADFRANLVTGVARRALANPLRAGLLAAATGELRVAGNRMLGIGPERFTGSTIAVAIDLTVRQVAADDNWLARVGDDSETPQPSPWQAIVLAGLSRHLGGEGRDGLVAPDVMILTAGTELLYLSEFRAELLPQGPGSASLRGNRLRGQITVAPLVDVDGSSLGCIFAENDAEVTGGAAAAAATSVARIRCAHGSAATNRLIDPGHMITLDLRGNPLAVLGNLTTGPIRVNGSALTPPWNALNINV